MATLVPKTLQLSLVILALVLAGCNGDTTGAALDKQTPATSTAPTSSTNAVDPEPIVKLVDPVVPGQLRFTDSENGLLRVNLSLQNATITVNGQSYVSTLYNGNFIPATWRLQPGDVLIVELDDNRYPVNDPANFTNIHFHGLNVPPQPPGDNVFIQVYPEGTSNSTVGSSSGGHGAHAVPAADSPIIDHWTAPTVIGSYRYSILIPENHPQGLFWWHAHPHGVSNTQVAGGMSGAMIIGNITADHYPQYAEAEEQVILLRDYSANVTPGSSAGTSIKKNPQVRTINGVPSAAFTIEPNQTQFWRFANIGANLDFDVALIGSDGTRVPFYLIAVDGNILENVTVRDHLFLHPGARMEAFIVGPAAGTYTLQNLPTYKKVGFNESAAPLGALVSVGAGLPVSPADGIGAARALHPDGRFYDLRDWVRGDNPTMNRTIVFNASPGGNTATVNGRPYDPNRDDTNVTYGDTEIWTIRNPTGAVHVFHIHQLDFLVLSENGVPVNATGLQDTVLIPPNVDGVDGSVQIAIGFTEPHMIGRYVYHCHYLAHEDNGMMANIVVDYNSTRGLPRTTSA